MLFAVGCGCGRRAGSPPSTASLTTTCCMQFDTTGEPSRPMIRMSRCSSARLKPASPWKLGVVEDDAGAAVIHAMPARAKFLKGWWTPSSATRPQRAQALERWADRVDPADLVLADTESLRTIAELAERRGELDAALLEAIRSARTCRSIMDRDRRNVGRLQASCSAQVRQGRGVATTPDRGSARDTALVIRQSAMVVRVGNRDAVAPSNPTCHALCYSSPPSAWRPVAERRVRARKAAPSHL